MINLYSGTPGSGKSLHCAQKIINSLYQHKYVIANFDIKPTGARLKRLYDKYFIHLDNDELEPGIIQMFSRNLSWCSGKRQKEDSIILVIDECQLLFNNREWAQHNRKEWISFFTQHRKFGYEVILIAQFDEMLDKQLRHLIEYEYIHRKASNFGWRGYVLMALLLSPHLFIWIQMWYPMKAQIESATFRYHKKVAQIYDSYQDFRPSEQLKTVTASTAGADR